MKAKGRDIFLKGSCPPSQKMKERPLGEALPEFPLRQRMGGSGNEEPDS
jgi:hypothetical protein